MTIIKTLSKSVREFKRDSMLSPAFVSAEVVLECMIPFFTARLINQMKVDASLPMILRYGIVLVIMAIFSLRNQGRKLCVFCIHRFCQKFKKRSVSKDSGLFLQ